MSNLEEYNPISDLCLPGTNLKDPEGIILIVGPNSSGKTRLLRDIESYLLTGSAEFVVCSRIGIRKPPECGKFLKDLEDKLLLVTSPTNDKEVMISLPFLSSIPQEPVGIGPQVETPSRWFQSTALHTICESFAREVDGRRHFCKTFGRILVAPLTLSERQRICMSKEKIDHKTQSPSVPIQSLSLGNEAQSKLATETGRVFGNAVWLDQTHPSHLILRASGSPQRPSWEVVSSARAAEKYNDISIEGDGFKSYVGICMVLLTGFYPVVLIDEPELCLHPPQAYHIGRFIGDAAKSHKHSTFVATHSSHVVRGILSTASQKKVTVLRLTNKGGKFYSYPVSQESLTSILENSRAKTESLLDGLFSQAVVLVESEGDREEYEAASEGITEYSAREIHFVATGGLGGFVDACKFYKDLGIPVAIIADLDSICRKELGSWIDLLCPDSSFGQALKQEIRDLVQKIAKLPPSITEEQVRSTLESIVDKPLSWEMKDDLRVAEDLEDVIARLKRVGSIKAGGIAAYAGLPDIVDSLKLVIEKCSKFGVFLVPVGELEYWVQDLMSGISKRGRKLSRSAIAAQRIRQCTPRDDDIWGFMRTVLQFFNSDPPA